MSAVTSTSGADVSRRPADPVVDGAAWIRSPAWDLGLLNLGWLPFYVLIVFGLGLDGTWSAGGESGAGREPGLGLAMSIAFGLSYVHRHYTFFIVYGDGETFDRHRTTFAFIPAVVFVLVAMAFRFRHSGAITLPGTSVHVSAWGLVLLITGAWNIWHTLMQRHGIHRVYAGLTRRFDGGDQGLASQAHGRRDKALLWVLVPLVATIVLTLRTETFAGIGNARKLLAVASPVLEGPVGISVLALTTLAAALVLARWLRFERGASVPWPARIPRILALSSTLALFGVFVVHGPVVGYLCFGIAHAIEYVAFVHHFGSRKFGRSADAPNQLNVLGLALRHASISAPIIIGALLLLYWLLIDARKTELFLVYYTATSILHFWFDGLIWKVSKPSVSRPLGIGPAATAK